MRTANTRIGIRVVKIPRIVIWEALAPERRYERRWLLRARIITMALRYLFLERASLVREIAPGERPLEMYEVRALREPRLLG